MVSLRKPPRSSPGANISANATLDLLRRFEPMAGFDWHSLATIARHVREVVVPANRVLVQPPRRLRGVWYLSAGALRDETGARLRAGSARARQPVYPGCRALRTLTATRLLYFGERCVPLLQPEQARVLPASGEDALAGAPSVDSRWLNRLAASPLLRLLYLRRGATGWQRWLRELERVDVDCEQRLIAQGMEGDYFYIVQRGFAHVSGSGFDASLSPASSAASDLLVVGPGGFFGEDALLSGQPRNAAVCMPQGGRVLRGHPEQLHDLVSDLWWSLARAEGSWRDDNRVLRVRNNLTTRSLRGWLGDLSVETRYGLPADGECPMQDLLLLLLLHRGYSVVLREGSARRMQTL